MNWKDFWEDYWPIIVMVALGAGLTGQFIWKMVYYPEPMIWIIIELTGVWGIVGLAIWGELYH